MSIAVVDARGALLDLVSTMVTEELSETKGGALVLFKSSSAS